jgi:glycerol-3-phosphate dehydrogenase
MRDSQSIQNTAYDLIVIGGGINGAAVARDAALRGLKTILFEKSDFASGTTSWSTRLIHGGLRYLEFFEFNLVRESLREREILLHTAPHLVKPLQLTIPIYGSGSRSYWEIQAGMILYDVLSFDKTLPSHRMLPNRKFQQLFRAVDADDLKGAAQYYDGQAARAERLCLENILEAEAAGAVVLNYVEVTALQMEGDRITQVTAKDCHSGQEFTVATTPKAVVINTAGPWVDQVCQRGEQGDRPQPLAHERKMGGTKGSHIVVDAFPGAPNTALYVEAKSDGRPFFIVPWLGQYLIGTTDLRYDGDLDRIKATNEEIDYLLRETNQVCPTAQLTRQDVRFTYSGVRPLPYTEGKSAGSITRKHILYDHSPDGVNNLVSLIGGKLTTFRQVGEELVDVAYQKMGQSAPPCPTRDRPFPGAMWPSDPLVREAIQTYGDRLPLRTLDALFDLYGARALEVLALVDASPDLAEPIHVCALDIRAQIVYAVQSEYAQTFTDILRRRTTLAMQYNYGFDLLPVVAETLQRHCGWTAAECDRQAQQYRTYMEENCLPDYVMQAQSSASKAPVSSGRQ